MEKIACAAVTSPERLEEWSKKAGNDGQVRFSWPPITCACLCRFTSSELPHLNGFHVPRAVANPSITRHDSVMMHHCRSR